jgi:TPR repeat protein
MRYFLWLAILVSGPAVATPAQLAEAEAALALRDTPAAAAIYESLVADPAALEARYQLSILLRTGLGMRADPARGLRLLEEAAAGGHAEALTSLGTLLVQGEEVPRDAPRGLALLEHAAGMGNAGAMYSLAFIHFRQRNDTATGFGWMRRAAEKGHAAAVNELAEMYRRGDGVPRDMVAALRWYRVGAVTDAYGERARLVEYYVNDAPDPVRAYAWMLLAGEAISPEGRGVVVARAAPKQVTAARALATRCRASGFSDCD